MAKQYSFYTEKPFQPHYNTSIGRYVTSQHQFDSELRRLSDAQSERTGIYHNYVSHEARDADAFGITEDGMDDFERNRHDNPVAPESIS